MFEDDATTIDAAFFLGDEPAEETATEEPAEAGDPQEESVQEPEQKKETNLDYEKSYKNLQSDYTKKAQLLKQLQRENDELKAKPPVAEVKPTAPQQTPEELNDILLELLTTNPAKALQMAAEMGTKQAMQQVQGLVSPLLQQQQATLAAQQDASLKANFDAVMSKYPGAEEADMQRFIDAAVDTAEKFGNEKLIYDADFMNMVGATVLGNQGFAKARKQGKNEAMQEILNKQGLAASASRSDGEAELSEDDAFFAQMMKSNKNTLW